MTEIISFEDTINKSEVVNSTIQNNTISFEDTINSNNINSTIQNNNVPTISFEDTIVKKDNNEFTNKTTQQPSQLNIEYINQHPDFESSGGFDIRLIPDFDSIEDASAYYGLPVDQLTNEIVPEVPMQGDNSYDNVNYKKKYIPNLPIEDGYYDKGSFNPFDDKKSDWSLTSRTMDYIWSDELGINKQTVEEIENPFFKKIAGSPVVMGASDILDGTLRTIQTVIYGGAGVVGDTVTNITGDKADGARTQRDLIALFESTLPQQMSTAGASARSWGYTKNQVKQYDTLGKKAIDQYVDTTFKKSPNKNKIKNELNKKFDEGIVKADTIINKLEQNVDKVLSDKRVNFKYFDDNVMKSRFKDNTIKLGKPDDVKNLLQFSESSILRNVDRFILAPFRTRGRKTPQMQKLYELYQGKIRGNNHRAVSTAKQIERQVNKIAKKFDPNKFNVKFKNKKEFKTKIFDDIQEVLIGKKSINTLDESLRQPVAKARTLIDDLSKQLIESKSLGKNIKEIIEKNVGSYVRQSYKLYRGGFNPNKQIRQNAFDYIQKQDPSLTNAEVNGVINKILDKGDNTNFASTVESLPKQSQSLFLKKKDIAPEIKALLGEVKNPLENLINTIDDLTKWVETDKYLNRIKENGFNKYIYKKPTNRFATEIEGNKYNPLKGYHTSPEIAKLLKSIDETSLHNLLFLYKVFLFGKGVSQYSKTVLNHVTQLRNLQGGILMAWFNGVNPFSRTGWSAFKTVANDIGKMSDEILNLKYQEYLDLGVVRTSVKINELKGIFKDVEMANSMSGFVDKITNNIVFKNAKKPLDFLQNVYMGVDDLFKIIVYEKELATLKRAYPDMVINPVKLKQLKKQASEITTNTMPTYDKVPPAIKYLRRLPIGNFVSFPAEILRNTVFSVKQGMKELGTANSVIKTRGAKRLAGNVIIGGFGLKVANEAYNTARGYTEDTIKAIKAFVPSWSQDSNITVLNDDPENIQYVDTSYTFPYDILHRPIRSAVNEWYNGKRDNKTLDEVIIQSSIASITTLGGYFLDESILASKINDILRNKQSNGRQVYNPELPVGDQVNAMFLHVLDAFVPAGYDQLEKLYKSFNGIVEPYGKEYDPKIELLANFGGLRVSEINVKEAFNFKIPEHNQNVNNAEKIFRKIANNQNVVTEQDYINAYITAEKARYKNWTDMNNLVQSAYELGLDENTVAEILIENNISKDDVKMYLQGRYLPYFPSKETLNRIYESGNTFPIEKIQNIYENIINVPLGDYQNFEQSIQKN